MANVEFRMPNEEGKCGIWQSAFGIASANSVFLCRSFPQLRAYGLDKVGDFMKHLLPGRIELLVFAVAAVVLAGLSYSAKSTDVYLAGLSVPLFIVCAILGMRRNERLDD
jgi:hypothetical protein